MPDLVRFDAARDLAVVRLGDVSESGNFKPCRGVTVKSISQSEIVGIHASSVRPFADVMVSNPIVIFGYPVSLGLKHIPQFEYDRPLLRRGNIAGKNEAKRTLVLDCPAYPGNSGGLVRELAGKWYNIGIVTEYVPAVQQLRDAQGKSTGDVIVNSGYSIAAPLDGVLGLLAAFL